jgi:hypothetical protein
MDKVTKEIAESAGLTREAPRAFARASSKRKMHFGLIPALLGGSL